MREKALAYLAAHNVMALATAPPFVDIPAGQTFAQVVITPRDDARRESRDFIDTDLIVSSHERIRAQLPQILDEIVRERVVIVDDENHARG